jgi:dephospho-CoA kinase
MLGYFFWSGRFEALGNEVEDYLIIPDVEKDYPEWKDKIVIGFSGGLSAGKTTAAEYLRSKGFTTARFSMVIGKLLEAKRKAPSRKNLQAMGDYVNQTKGQRWLCKHLIQELVGDEKHVVIDGLRFPEDHAYMKEKFGPHFTHIHIECDVPTRRNRYYKSSRNNVSFRKATDHPVERAARELSKLADAIIVNDKSLRFFYIQLGRLLEQIKLCQSQSLSAASSVQKARVK